MSSLIKGRKGAARSNPWVSIIRKRTQMNTKEAGHLVCPASFVIGNFDEFLISSRHPPVR